MFEDSALQTLTLEAFQQKKKCYERDRSRGKF